MSAGAEQPRGKGNDPERMLPELVSELVQETAEFPAFVEAQRGDGTP